MKYRENEFRAFVTLRWSQQKLEFCNEVSILAQTSFYFLYIHKTIPKPVIQFWGKLPVYKKSSHPKLALAILEHLITRKGND